MQDDSMEYLAVSNDEGQYALWPAHLPLAQGWRDGGMRGTKSECLEHIRLVWTDMRPISLQKIDALR
jgi:MbtH protein